MQAAKATPSLLLPALRQDLRLFSGSRDAAAPSWLIYDPLRHRYFQISHEAYGLLQIWQEEPADQFARRAAQEFGRDISGEELSELVRFLSVNNLTLDPPQGDARIYAYQEERMRHSLPMRLVHNYLFFKLPLVRPHRFLEATLPLVAPLYTRGAFYALLAITAAGLYFASRQWDVFVSTFLDFFTLEGAAIYAVSLALIKTLHELGHAYTATRAGVRVNTMGVAFMVLVPLLYSDVTDAWRLEHRRQKLAIDVAGIAVELAVAGLATFLWAFLPDGALRSVAFVLATTSWILTLAINLNPLMRFDGYYLLADAWGIPNLQPRSNAMAQWRLREWLFNLGHAPPEVFPRRTRALLIAYAFAVWVYRFTLFVGIALVVYHMFFKALGIVLFVIEIAWFVALPIWREIKEWWSMRSEIVLQRRAWGSLAAVAGLLIVAFIPWSSTVQFQAVSVAGQETKLFAPRPARVEQVLLQEGQPVTPGVPLLVLEAPELDYELAQTKFQADLARLRLDRVAGDNDDRSNLAVIQSELASAQEKLAGLSAEKRRLTISAPHGGVVRDLDRDLQPGQWLDDVTAISRVVAQDVSEAKGYLSDEEVWRVSAGADAVFVPEDAQLPKRRGKLIDVAPAGTRNMDLPYLSSVYGGAVASDRNGDGEIRPRSGRYLVRVMLDPQPEARVVRGTLHVTGKAESFASAAWRRVLQVLVRESGA